MKYLLFILLFCACETPRQARDRESKKVNAISGIGNDLIYIVVIDGCEYVVYHGSQKGGIVHHAKCHNHQSN